MIIKEKDLKVIMDKLSEIEIKSKSKYEYLGKRVPRVTEVLSAMLHEDYLMKWANGLGFKRISYRAFMTEAADKGTYSHMAIERYLKQGYLDLEEMTEIPNSKIMETVSSVMTGFYQWWNKLHKDHKKIELIYLEKTLIHKYFAGTCDCLLKVDDEYWLIDFKTSNHMSYNYALQLAAYKYLLKELEGIDISRAMVLRLDKVVYRYYTYEYDLKNNEEHIKFFDDCLQTFMLLCSAFIMRMYSKEEYDNILKNIETIGD
jgi:hypothetical protein